MGFREDLERGHLVTGEPLEALYGTGWWTEDPRDPYCPPIIQCPVCGGQAYDLEETLDCENCGEIPFPGTEESDDEAE